MARVVVAVPDGMGMDDFCEVSRISAVTVAPGVAVMVRWISRGRRRG